MATKQISITNYPVSVTEAKHRLRIDGAADDADLQMMIEAATDLAASFTRRAIAATTWQLKLDSFPEEIRLLYPPVVSVTSLTYVDVDGNVQTLSDSAYSLDNNSEPAWILPTDGTEWPETKDTANAVTVNYTSGYGTSCPAAIKQFILLQVAHMYRNREAVSDKPLVMIPYGERLLDKYKLWEV